MYVSINSFEISCADWWLFIEALIIYFVHLFQEVRWKEERHSVSVLRWRKEAELIHVFQIFTFYLQNIKDNYSIGLENFITGFFDLQARPPLCVFWEGAWVWPGTEAGWRECHRDIYSLCATRKWCRGCGAHRGGPNIEGQSSDIHVLLKSNYWKNCNEVLKMRMILFWNWEREKEREDSWFNWI